ncbi:uncharacterized protein LOC123272923 [Cotesia glomerata]|uniref:Uncharacterized protein n=1 Tax=Cotesia glomerata TaxID=32391 RepID=A0AAV7J1U2_COTGL|nr:uncharacterized protein LOC123272923 [Cotesia glomerata]KAH0563676.1 hypothetical protein KQX54_004367 [Cotesia glomerata]
MEYALVKIPHENDKKVVVETCHIKNFSTFNVLTQNQVYRYDDGVKKFKCIILHQSDSRDYLLKPKFRIREPVITNPSSLESSSDNEKEAESGVTNAKEARKPTLSNHIRPKLKDTKILEQNPLMERLMKDNRKKDEENIKLKRQLQQYRLITSSNQLQKQQEQQQKLEQPQKQRYDPYYYIDHDTFHVGDDIYIPSSTSREAFDAPNPSKFIKTMSFLLFGAIKHFLNV